MGPIWSSEVIFIDLKVSKKSCFIEEKKKYIHHYWLYVCMFFHLWLLYSTSGGWPRKKPSTE